MTFVIEKIFQVSFWQEFCVSESRCIGLYRMRKMGNWSYCIVTGCTPDTLPMEFDGLEAFWSVGSNQKWHDNWEDVMDRLNDFPWQYGIDAWCHPDYRERIWRYYDFWQGLNTGYWLSVGNCPNRS